jgi:hypothetical protein
MKNFILGLLFISSPFLLLAHNPLSAKYHLEAGENISLLNISLSQVGLNQALLKSHDEAELNKMEQKEFKELIVEYVKSNFFLSIDNEKIELKKGGIKFGAHQTDLKFIIPPVSKETKEVHIHIPAFKENGYHQTIFSYKIFDKVDKVILDFKNSYESTIRLGEPVISNQASFSNWIWIGLGGLMMISLILFGVKSLKKPLIAA